LKKIDCVYLMGGTGERAKLGFPKQFQLLGGKPIFIHGLETLEKIQEINQIIIVSCNIEQTQNIIKNYQFTKEIIYASSGVDRIESVSNGIYHVKTQSVLISESVRPFITKDLYMNVINENSKVVTPIKKAVSTVIDLDGCSYDRRMFGEVQMPQKFSYDILQKLHIKARIEKVQEIIELFTDDIAILNYFSSINNDNDSPINTNCIKVIPGEDQNLKITSPIDLIIAEAIYEKFNNKRDE